MNYKKGFAAVSILAIALGILVLGGIGYTAMNPQSAQAPYDGTYEIVWNFADAGENVYDSSLLELSYLGLKRV